MQMDLPLFHFSGNLNCHMAMACGSQVIISPKFSASKAVETLKKYQSTHMVYIGETLRFINNVPEKSDDHENSLKVLLGNGLSRNEWLKFLNRFGKGKDIWINEVYGATELPNVLHRNFLNNIKNRKNSVYYLLLVLGERFKNRPEVLLVVLVPDL